MSNDYKSDKTLKIKKLLSFFIFKVITVNVNAWYLGLKFEYGDNLELGTI